MFRKTSHRLLTLNEWREKRVRDTYHDCEQWLPLGEKETLMNLIVHRKHFTEWLWFAEETLGLPDPPPTAHEPHRPRHAKDG